MSNTKKIIIISTVAFLLVALLVFALYHVMTAGDSSNNGPGLLKPNETVMPSVSTEGDRQNEYEQREELSESVAETLGIAIKRYLSAGDLDDLDKKLDEWLKKYKDTADDAVDEIGIISSYQADIAFFKNVTNPKNKYPTTTWRFSNPDMLAAAISFAPISTKYLAIISHRSTILPEALSDIKLRKAEKTPQELREMLEDINRTRSVGTEFQMLSVYDVEIRGVPCEILMVSNTDTMRWEVYSIEPKDGVDLGVYVQTCYDIMMNEPGADLDALIVMPVVIE